MKVWKLPKIQNQIIYIFRCKTNILHVTARHSNQSNVARATNELLPKLKFDYNLTERNLWEESLPPYNLDHVKAKFNLMKNPESDLDQHIFEPIREIVEEINDQDILIVSTPMWNLSLPYVLKQYIDIIIQPGE